MTLAPEYIDHQIHMGWPDICRMACRAMILNMSLDEFAELAMRQYFGEAP